MRLKLKGLTKPPAVVWPGLEEEIGEYKTYFKGKVLNAGAGLRDLSSVVDGTLVNQDIPQGLHNNIYIYSPIHDIPVDDDHFDAVICNAVLEHVANPIEVVREIHRVLKPGGYFYLSIPFYNPSTSTPRTSSGTRRTGCASWSPTKASRSGRSRESTRSIRLWAGSSRNGSNRRTR